MSLKNQKSAPAKTVSKKLSSEVKVKLSDSSFSVLKEAVSKNSHFASEAQKAQKELQSNLIIAIEGAGLKVEDYAGVNLNTDTKELILTKKK